MRTRNKGNSFVRVKLSGRYMEADLLDLSFNWSLVTCRRAEVDRFHRQWSTIMEVCIHFHFGANTTDVFHMGGLLAPHAAIASIRQEKRPPQTSPEMTEHSFLGWSLKLAKSVSSSRWSYFSPAAKPKIDTKAKLSLFWEFEFSTKGTHVEKDGRPFFSTQVAKKCGRDPQPRSFQSPPEVAFIQFAAVMTELRIFPSGAISLFLGFHSDDTWMPFSPIDVIQE